MKKGRGNKKNHSVRKGQGNKRNRGHRKRRHALIGAGKDSNRAARASNKAARARAALIMPTVQYHSLDFGEYSYSGADQETDVLSFSVSIYLNP